MFHTQLSNTKIETALSFSAANSSFQRVKVTHSNRFQAASVTSLKSALGSDAHEGSGEPPARYCTTEEETLGQCLRREVEGSGVIL